MFLSSLICIFAAEYKRNNKMEKKKLLTLLLSVAMGMATYAGNMKAKDAAKYEQELITEWKDSVRNALSDSYNSKELKIGSYTMPIHWSIFGDKPDDGYALFISLQVATVCGDWLRVWPTLGRQHR